MEQFNFRIIHANGVDIFDTNLCTPYRNLVNEILLESLSDKYCTCADTDLLLVEVKGDDINEK